MCHTCYHPGASESRIGCQEPWRQMKHLCGWKNSFSFKLIESRMCRRIRWNALCCHGTQLLERWRLSREEPWGTTLTHRPKAHSHTGGKTWYPYRPSLQLFFGGFVMAALTQMRREHSWSRQSLKPSSMKSIFTSCPCLLMHLLTCAKVWWKRMRTLMQK